MEKLCKRPSCGKPRYPGKKWCSIDCARLAGAKLTPPPVSSTRSTSAGASSSKAPGEASRARAASRPSELAAIASAGGLTRSSASESERVVRALPPPPPREDDGESFLQPSEPSSTESEKSDASAILREMLSSEPGTPPPASDDSPTSATTETREIPRASSTEPLLTLEQESYVQTSLVDDAIRRLHLQMQRLTFDPRAPRAHHAPVDVSDKMEITRAKLACATATSMARMLKTKIDAARLFSKTN